LESEWRWNVALFGMSGSAWRLCARFVDDPDFVVVADRVYPFPRYSVWDVSDPDQLPVFVGNFLITTHPPTFPYGNDVEPD